MPQHFQVQLREFVQGKNVLVFGVGKQGGGSTVAHLLTQLGAHVRITDLKTADELDLPKLSPEIEHSLGGHKPEDIEWADLIIKNPAVPFSHPLMILAEETNTPVTTETALALRYIRDNTIGITGTRGKTTTTHLIHHLLTAAGKKALIGGNIPQHPTLSLLQDATEDTLFVIEISSFHIEAMQRDHVSPKYAVLTNIYPDHLNRYETLQEYANTKAAIFAWQQPGDHAYWNGDPEWNTTVTSHLKSSATFHHISADEEAQMQHFTSDLPGRHNQENVAVAAAVVATFEIDQDTIQQGLNSFHSVPHRLQTIATIQDITFINDTTSTTPIALEKALEAIDPPYILIAGGTSKHLPFSEELLEHLRKLAPNTVWIKGTGTQELLDDLYDTAVPDFVSVVDSLEAAVQTAFALAKKQRAQSVLFSPGFTSFEMFDNEFHRGDSFVACVKKLTPGE